MAAELIDSYEESNSSSSWAISADVVSYYVEAGQSFKPTVTRKITSCKFYVKKHSTETGNAVAKLYAHDGTFGGTAIPTGSPLATSDNFDISTLTTDLQLIEITFTGDNQYAMQADTPYFIVFSNPNGSATEYVSVGIDTTSATHAGRTVLYDASWGVQGATMDMVFYVYGEEVVEVVSSKRKNPLKIKML